MHTIPALEHGPCWACGTDTMERCYYQNPPGGYTAPYCYRWLCEDHLVIEVPHWYGENLGPDVEYRCQEHRSRALDVQDLFRGRALPPALRWRGREDEILAPY